MKIQRLILQDVAYKEIICADEELLKNTKEYDLETGSIYARLQNAEFLGQDEKGIVIHPGGSVSFDTFLNSYSTGKWAKYTVIDTLEFSAVLKGEARIRLFHAWIEETEESVRERRKAIKKRRSKVDNKGVVKTEEIASCTVNHASFAEARLAFGALKESGIFYAKIESVRDEVVICAASYDTADREPTQKVKLAIDICTFKREPYVKRNMGILRKDILENPESPLYRNLWIHISDNASSLDGIVDSDEFITVDKNANLGGVGGFTRGIIETKKRKEFTHVLLMDDDASINSASVELNYMLLSYLKPEYFGYTIGGKLMVLNVPYLQFEAGAVWNRGKIIAYKNELDVRRQEDVLENEMEHEEEKLEYNGWWYCCIPLSEIKDDDLPLPIFIHRDDIEYGLRVGRGRFILLNGICIWHEAFAGKMPGALDYYDLRNEAIINAIHCPQYKKRNFKRVLCRWMLVNMLRYRYKYVEYNRRAAEDFCKGIDWLLEVDGEQLHKDLLSMNYKAKKIYDYVGFKGLTKEELEKGEQGDYKLPYLVRLFHRVTLNGYFFPVKKDKVTVNAPYGSVYKLYRVGECVITDNNKNAVYVSRDRSEFFRCIKMMRETMKLIDKKYDEAAKGYRERYRELTSNEFWNNYLGIDKGCK